jgi:hypothetical protein
VAVDEDRGRVYWTDLGDSNSPSAVYSANLDGSDARKIISAVSLAEIAGIAIDRERDKIYFSFINPLIDSLYAGGIARADLDGSNWEPIVGGLGRPLGLAVDSSGKEIYLADAGLAEGEGAIKATSVAGSQPRTILGGLGAPFGVALDLGEKNVYWTDTQAGKIQRTAMPGVLPFFQDVITELPAPTAIAIRNDGLPGSIWNADMNGNWSTASNWDPGVPNGIGQRAVFGDIITAPRTVTMDSRFAVGSIEFDNTNAYTIAGFAGLTLNAGAGDAHIRVTKGRHVISAPLNVADDVVITVVGADSRLSLTQPLGNNTAALTKAGAGTLEVRQLRAEVLVLNGGAVALSANNPASIAGSLDIAGTATTPLATFDVADGGFVVNYPSADPTPANKIRQWILAARGGAGLGKPWTGTGITSRRVQADVAASPNSTSVAYAENAKLPGGAYATFRGQPVDATSVLIGYTRTGDANLDGVVNNDDVAILGANYAPGFAKAEWALGDFDYNGFVDNDDVALLGVFYEQSGATANAIETVPEPATAVLSLAGCIGALVAVGLGRRRLIRG